MRRIGSWKSWSKKRKVTTGVCGVCVIAVVAGAIGLSGGSDTEVIYKETTVKYGTLVKGVTERQILWREYTEIGRAHV